MRNTIKKLLASIVLLVITLLLCSPFKFGHNENCTKHVDEHNENYEKNTDSAEALPQSAKPAEEASEVITAALPHEVSDAMAEISISTESIGDCEQLLMVTTDGSSAKITEYEVNTLGNWECINLIVDGYIGSCGATQTKTEGDKKTPMGLFELGIAFGNEEKPDTKLSYRQIDQDSYWVDDSTSEKYNTWVEGTDNRDWNSAEHLSDYQNAYALAIVIEYNTNPVIPNAGSAIFLHCGLSPTAGCVSVSHDNMLEILKWLNPSKNPMILIH